MPMRYLTIISIASFQGGPMDVGVDIESGLFVVLGRGWRDSRHIAVKIQGRLLPRGMYVKWKHVS